MMMRAFPKVKGIIENGFAHWECPSHEGFINHKAGCKGFCEPKHL
jgi:hypothetical protein